MVTNYIKPRSQEHHPLEVIRRAKAEGRVAYIAGPMVRYSKLPFRALVRNYNVDIVYSPMILAREFVRNSAARDSDFSTNSADTPLVVQIGASNVEDLLKMVEMIHPYCDGIGINCGCPIKEQVREGIGAALMSKPELVAEMVRSVKQKFGPDFCVEVKIRIHKDINDTIRYAKMVEAAGVDYLTVHGRLQAQRSSTPPNYDAIRMVKEAVKCPVVANGDAFSLEDVSKIEKMTGVDGVMAVRGILANPAMFAGYEKTPWSAVELFWDYATAYGLPFRLIQHHFSEMLYGVIPKEHRNAINECNSLVELIDRFDSTFVVRRRGDEKFATAVEPCYKRQMELVSHI